ncbi:hypothetical protein OG909_14925 [Streptomyces sp. NBC_01754]|uniref:hypothetical protein n=1 Tax=Streptomyces sp. NBC_01754 TaxID=2975930 RepID=UPI002DDA2FAF|nr:hypothetical protein [Streptomyces sp. NBC_01754]WSC93472.1 hypothetical protein OG909_14925 [Streptomyces sp. NBC_01754]
MSRRHLGTHGRSTPLRRVWDAVVREFSPPPAPRPRPSTEQLAEGHLAVGTIDDAVEDGPSDVQGPDMLVISAETPEGGTLHRRAACPLSMPGSGRDLIGQAVTFRHTTLDPDFVDDVLVVRWPDKVRKALEPFRPTGPGAVRARIWHFLAQCGAVLTVGGILGTVVMLIGVIFTKGELFADLPAWFRPGVALAASAGAAVLGPAAFAVCSSRVRAALVHPSRSSGSR